MPRCFCPAKVFFAVQLTYIAFATSKRIDCGCFFCERISIWSDLKVFRARARNTIVSETFRSKPASRQLPRRSPPIFSDWFFLLFCNYCLLLVLRRGIASKIGKKWHICALELLCIPGFPDLNRVIASVLTCTDDSCWTFRFALSEFQEQVCWCCTDSAISINTIKLLLNFDQVNRNVQHETSVTEMVH